MVIYVWSRANFNLVRNNSHGIEKDTELMFTQEGGGGAYTVTSRRGAKIKVRKGVARLSYETKRKIYIIKRNFLEN